MVLHLIKKKKCINQPRFTPTTLGKSIPTSFHFSQNHTISILHTALTQCLTPPTSLVDYHVKPPSPRSLVSPTLVPPSSPITFRIYNPQILTASHQVTMEAPESYLAEVARKVEADWHPKRHVNGMC